MTQFDLSQLLISTGAILLILGTGITIFSKRYKTETFLKSKSLQKMKILSKGNPVIIDEIFTPCPASLKVEFKSEKFGKKAIFRLIRNVKNIENYQIPYGEKLCWNGNFNFILDPDAKYTLEVESNVGMNSKGLDAICRIFSKYNFNVQKGENDIKLIENHPGGGQSISSLKRLIAMFQPAFDTNLKGEELKNALINDAKISGHDKKFHDWYLRHPTIFDEIADVVNSYSQREATFFGDINYTLVKVERPYEWLFSVGLTCITTSVVVLLAGLK